MSVLRIALVLLAIVVAVFGFAIVRRFFIPGTTPLLSEERTAVFGTLIEKTAEAFSIELQDGSVRTIYISTSTNFLAAPVPLAYDGVVVGAQVGVSAIEGANGSLDARSVQVLPPRPAPSATSSPAATTTVQQ